MVDSERQRDADGAAGEPAKGAGESATTDASKDSAAASDSGTPAPAEDASVASSAPSAAEPAAAAPAGPPFWAKVRRFFWMDEKLAAAHRVAFSPESPGYVEFERGREALVASQRLSELAEGELGVLLLHREVAQLLIAAQAARAGLESDPEPTARWAALRAHATGEAALTGADAVDRELLDSFLAADGARFAAGLAKDRRAKLASVVARVTERLAERLEGETRRVTSVLCQRWFRIVSGAVLLIALLGGLVALARSLGPQVNIARDKPVRLSSHSRKYGCDPRRLVDGNHNELGFHTNRDNQPWVEIDLGGEHWVHRVVVYNRATHRERAVPLAVEIAKRPGRFEEVARRNEVFDVWTTELPSAKQAKTVRLKLLKKSFFHLAEIEVY